MPPIVDLIAADAIGRSQGDQRRAVGFGALGLNIATDHVNFISAIIGSDETLEPVQAFRTACQFVADQRPIKQRP